MFRILFQLLGAAVLSTQALVANADVIPVELEPVRHNRAVLVVAGAQGETSYDPAALEAMGAMRMTTITPWREDAAQFDGVLLRDVLAANGLADATTIRVTAENGFATEIGAEIWQRWPLLLATRVNGKPHSRRARGPIQLVFPMSDDPSAGEGTIVNKWVWMAARIERVD